MADKWVWCLHCERCYRYPSEMRSVRGSAMCAYADCDGDAFFDAWDWSRFVELWSYPEVPERGVRYSQFGEGILT